MRRFSSIHLRHMKNGAEHLLLNPSTDGLQALAMADVLMILL